MGNHKGYEEKPESWWNYTHSFFYRRFFESQEERIKEILSVLNPKVVLDAGCGYGRYTKILKDMNIDVHSIDKSRPMIEKVKQINPKAKLCTVENIDYPDDFFDVVFCSDVACHLESVERAMKEFGRVLKEDGFLLLTVEISHSPLILLNRILRLIFERLMERPPISRGYSEKEMKKILKDFALFQLTLYHYGIPIQNLYICRKF